MYPKLSLDLILQTSTWLSSPNQSFYPKSQHQILQRPSVSRPFLPLPEPVPVQHSLCQENQVLVEGEAIPGELSDEEERLEQL